MDRWFPIRTARLCLREFRATDEGDIHAYASDPEVVRYASWGPNTIVETRAVLDAWLGEQRHWPRSSVTLAIELVAEGRLVGAIRLDERDAVHRSGDFGYTISRGYWNHGIATEAGRGVLGAAFGVLGWHRAWATCDTRNGASRRVLEKLGLRREGEMRQDTVRRGVWADTYLYAILSEEWGVGSSRSDRSGQR
ncbi:MAG TPA: GNAT family N-acetyltransferase [Gemmatimonadaceae bacterium]|jgi:ribosomal-protein-alanine N-acetyltransferase|nr:GNAT family N-acetyltransferase [Gemmatimonadaceae bacterium]